MSAFSRNWEKKSSPNDGRGLGGLIRNPPPVRPQIEKAMKELAKLISMLGQAEARVKARDETIFGKVVYALQRGDREHASIYANELSEVRKVGTTVSGAKLALEQVTLRLTTITDLGDVAATLAPTIAVVRGVGQGLGTVLPSAQGELSEISSLLSATLTEAGSVGGTSLNFEAANDEAEQVLQEASNVAYQRMEEQYPRLPISRRNEEQEGLTS